MQKKPNNVMKHMVQGQEYETPEIPAYSTIRNHDLPRDQQIWTRDLTYESFDWDDDWQETADDEQLMWLEDEIEKLYIGTWIMINGKPMYLNNYTYFWLQWYVLEDGSHPTFMDTCLEVYRFSELCDKARLCLGYTLLKGRRLGASSMAASEILLMSIISRSSLEGIISKTGTDAQEVFDFVVNAFQGLPVFLKPRTEGSDSPKKTLVIKQQGGKIKKDQKVASGRKGLNNRVTWGANALNTFDGRKLLRALVDEAGKFEELSISAYLQVVSKCVTIGATVIGKIIMPTTVNSPNKGGLEYRAVWDGSDFNRADSMGRTKTGLYRLFIPAYMGYRGYIDFDGSSIWDTPTPKQRAWLAQDPDCPNPNIGAKEFLEGRRELYKNDEEGLNEEKRQSPFTAEEVFEAASNGCRFNMKEINDRMEVIMAMMEAQGMSVSEKSKDELGRRGWFVPCGNDRVRWIDDDKGMWYVYKFLPEGQDNLFERRGDKFYPANTALGAAGLDPFAHVSAAQGGSDASIIIRERLNPLDIKNSGAPIAMFLGRPTKKRHFHEQIANGLRYFGVKLLGEIAPSDWIDYFVDNKIEGYLIKTIKANGDMVYGINPQNKDGREAHLTEQIESSHTDHDKIMSLRHLRDRLGFDPDKRTVYDVCMADGYALMALKEPYLKKKKADKKTKKFFRKGKIHVG